LKHGVEERVSPVFQEKPNDINAATHATRQNTAVGESGKPSQGVAGTSCTYCGRGGTTEPLDRDGTLLWLHPECVTAFERFE
jgi:hypothetical protein